MHPTPTQLNVTAATETANVTAAAYADACQHARDAAIVHGRALTNLICAHVLNAHPFAQSVHMTRANDGSLATVGITDRDGLIVAADIPTDAHTTLARLTELIGGHSRVTTLDVPTGSWKS